MLAHSFIRQFLERSHISVFCYRIVSVMTLLLNRLTLCIFPGGKNSLFLAEALSMYLIYLNYTLRMATQVFLNPQLLASW